MNIKEANLYVVDGEVQTFVKPSTTAQQVSISAEDGSESTVDVEIQSLRASKMSVDGGTFQGDVYVNTCSENDYSSKAANTKWVVNHVESQKIVVDDDISASSSNPVENKAIVAYLNNYVPYADLINEYVKKSGGVYTGEVYGNYAISSANNSTLLATTQWVNTAIANAITIDTALDDTSTNPIQNKVVAIELDKKMDKNGDTIVGDITINNADFAIVTGNITISNGSIDITDMATSKHFVADVANNSLKFNDFAVITAEGGSNHGVMQGCFVQAVKTIGVTTDTVALNGADGNIFQLTLNAADISISVGGLSEGQEIIVIIDNPAGTCTNLTWGDNVYWDSGVVATVPAADNKVVVKLIYIGSVLLGFVIGKDFAVV